MKKELINFVVSMGGRASYSGRWPATLFVEATNKEQIINALIKKFTRHTQVRFV